MHSEVQSSEDVFLTQRASLVWNRHNDLSEILFNLKTLKTKTKQKRKSDKWGRTVLNADQLLVCRIPEGSVQHYNLYQATVQVSKQ